MHIFARTAQCYLSKIEQQNITGKGKKNILKRVKILLDFAQKWGKMYQAFWGLALRVKGNYFWVMGKKKKADGFFVKAIDFSSENGHKQELAYAYYDYGRNLLKDSGKSERLIGKARECLSKARDIFIKIGAAPAADMAGELLCIKPGTQTSMSENTHSSEDLSTQDRLSIERRMETVLDTSRYLSSILDLNELLEKIMDKTIELVGAERGIVFLNQKDKKSEGHLTARVLRNIDKEDPSIKAIQEAVAERVMKEKKPFIIEDASLDKEMTAISTRSSRVNGLKSMLCAPIIAKNEVLGVIYLDNHLVTGLFNLKDMSVLEMIAGQAGVSIENAILYQNLKEQERLKSEMAIAEKIQTSLAPVIPLHPDLEITAVMRPAEEVGGDYYDIIEDNQKNLWFAIGDVTGHGVTPGLIMMMAQSSFSTVIKAKKDLSPKTALMEVNSTLFENITNRLHESQNMTMKFVKYLGNGSFIYANAAHPDIFIYRKRTGTCELLSMPSTFLGFLPDISDSIDESSFSLESGDIMLLYSDGITESRKREDDSLWGEEKMQEILIQSAHLGLDSVRDKILNEAMEWCENRPRDDMTLLLVKRK